MNSVNLAIVGCGTISQLNAPAYLQHPRCEITALCDPIRERAEGRASQWGITPKIYTRFEDVLDDPNVDAVELLTPTRLHAGQSIAALEAGKHVSSQKPVCNTVAEADLLAAAVEKAETRYRVTENYLYYPPLVKAKELLESGAIGEPSILRVNTIRGSQTLGASFTLEPEAYVWRRDADANAGGYLFDGGWHVYATAIWLLGEVEKVQAMITRTEDFLLEMPASIIWKMKGRDCLVTFDFSYAERMRVRGSYYPIDEFFEIQGSDGNIWVTRCTGEMLDMPPVVMNRGNESTAFHVPSDWAESFKGAARDFVDSILTGKQAHMDIGYSKRVLQATLAAYRASESGAAVDPSTIR